MHADWRSGKHKNASWVPKNKCKCPLTSNRRTIAAIGQSVTSVSDPMRPIRVSVLNRIAGTESGAEGGVISWSKGR